MSSKKKNIVIGLFFNLDAWKKSLKSASSSWSGFTKEIANSTVALYGLKTAFDQLKNIVSTPLELAIANEQAATSFDVLLGSASAANDLIKDLKKQAAQNPFNFQDMAKNAKTLLGFGIAADQVRSDLKMLADVASGDRDRFKSLSLAFAQVSAAGRLMGQDLLQLINAGFNPLQTISKRTGESMSELKDRMQRGAISFAEVRQAFQDATNEGGLFYKMNEKIFGTLGGAWSALQNNISESLAAIGEAMIETFDLKTHVKSLLELSNTFTDDYLPTIKAAFRVTKFFTDTLVWCGKVTWTVAKTTLEWSKILISAATGFAAVTAATTAWGVAAKAFVAIQKMWTASTVILTAAQATLQVLLNPANALKVAAALLVGVGTYTAMTMATNAATEAAEAHTDGMKKELDVLDQHKVSTTAATAALAELNSQRDRANQTAKDLKKSLEFDLKNYGMSDFDKKILKLSDEGADTILLNQVTYLQQQIDKLDELEKAKQAARDLEKQAEKERQEAAEYWKKRQADEKKALEDRAKSIINANKTEQEIYQETMAELKKLNETKNEFGAKLLDDDQFARASAAAKAKLDQSNVKDTMTQQRGNRFGQLATAGTKESYSQIIRHQFGNADGIISISKQQLAEQKKQTKAAQITAKNTAQKNNSKNDSTDVLVN